MGDRVRVTRKAEDHENGWGTAWYEGQWDDGLGMNEAIGEILYVTEDCNDLGFGCGSRNEDNNNYMYPYFVLEKI